MHDIPVVRQNTDMETTMQAASSSQLDSVVAEIEIAAPPDRVFQALTDSDQLFRWWSAEPSCDLKTFEFDARPGGEWRFRCLDRAGRPVNGVTDFQAHGKVLEIKAPRLLVYTWIANWHDHPDHETVVRWELSPSSAGTKVKVIHSGLAQETVARKDYAGGWLGVLQLLKNFLVKK